MKKTLIFITVLLFSVFFLVHKSGEIKVIEPGVAFGYIGSFDNLVEKVKEANISGVGYKRLLSVLEKMTSTKDMSIYQSEEATTVFDAIRGYHRLRLFIFNAGKPLMKVEVLSDSTLIITVLDASLVIS